jgi:hypothetical protein
MKDDHLQESLRKALAKTAIVGRWRGRGSARMKA